MTELPERVSFPALSARTGDGPPATTRPCPNCESTGTEVVYEVAPVPIHSCVLLESQAAATAFPTGRVRWAWCPACTFLFNAAFDPAAIDYSEDYEETQGYSGTFTRWLEGVVDGLAARHALAGKRVVEIGCGRGDFLELLCRRTGAEGIGIDPSSTAGRVDHGAGRGLRFLREDFGPQHAELGADAIVCRHTLEHLFDARGLLGDVRAALGPGGIAFFEVPDVDRQLAEGAFWDIYYEHCAYYGEASLRAVFESTGFEVLALERVYGDQYLQITARPAEAPPPAPVQPSEPVRDRVAAAVEAFARTCEASLSTWNAFRRARAEDGTRVVLWGSGSKATGFLTTLGWEVGAPQDGGLELVVDINPDKWGRHVAGSGQRIVAPAELTDYRPRHVVVMNPIYVDEIAEELARHGCRPELHPLGR